MTLLQTLKSLIEQRLCAAAEDIFMDVERILTEQHTTHTLLHIHTADLPLLSVCKEEVYPEPQERSSSLVQEEGKEEPESPQEEPEPQQVKEEEQEELLLRPEEADDGSTLTLSSWKENLDTLSVSVNSKTLSHHNLLCSKSPISCIKMLEPSDVFRARILSALPSLPVEVVGRVVERLTHHGARTEEDLQYVGEQDIKGLMKPIQCRKLLNAWKRTEPMSMSAPPRQMSTCVPLDQSSSVSTSSPTFSPPASPRYWPDNFKVNWDKMPLNLRTALRNGKRPSPEDRRQMVRVIVDDMERIAANPRRAECLVVARNIVDQYPQSFIDSVDDATKKRRTNLKGVAYDTLLSQITSRVGHVNRKNPLARHRRSSKKNRAKPPQGPPDAYGCTQWQPELPPEETEESLENKRRMLTELFSREGSSGTERADVSTLMETTYSLQRQMINANPAPGLHHVKQQWPYLFFPRGMCTHFERLTDVPILLKIRAFHEEHGSNIMEFFKRNPTNDAVKAVLHRTDCSVTAANILQVLMAHFKEPLDALVIQTDESATPAFVQLTVPLVDTPRLIVAGPMTESNQRWMMSIENQVLCEGTSFLDGLAVVISSYYNFNLQYQHDAACTLEFIQRSCIDISPEGGTKASQEMMVQSKKGGEMVRKKVTPVNPHVSALIKKLIDFKWNFV